MNTRYMIVCLFIAALSYAGCAATERGPYSPVAREDGRQPHQLGHGVTMLDMNVRNSFLLINHSAKRSPGGQIQSRVTMQNIFKDNEVWADVRFIYFNADGEPVEQSEWRTYNFPPMELVLVENNSIRGDVQQFNAQFKNLRTRDGRELTYPDSIYEHGSWKDGVMPQ
jgi:hypothetical protein